MDGQATNKSGQMQNRDYDRLLTEQFIIGLNTEGMTDEILREVAILEDIEEAIRKHMLTLAHRVEVQSSQMIALNSIIEAKELDAIQQNT